MIPIPPYGLGDSSMVWQPWLLPIVLWWNSWHRPRPTARPATVERQRPRGRRDCEIGAEFGSARHPLLSPPNTPDRGPRRWGQRHTWHGVG